MGQIATVGLQAFDARIKDVSFIVAADVDNPLCGPHGASAVFGPQKGADGQDVALLDDALSHFADLCAW